MLCLSVYAWCLTPVRRGPARSTKAQSVGDIVGLIHVPALQGAQQLPFKSNKRASVAACLRRRAIKKNKDAHSQRRDDALEPTKLIACLRGVVIIYV